MNYPKLITLISSFTLLLFFISACGASQQPPPTTTDNTAVTDTKTEQATTFTDPFAYCQAVGTIDKPDAQYTGKAVPELIVNSMIAEQILSENMPTEMIDSGTLWRCMNKKVLTCFVGANLPCTEKADSSTTPTTAMESFCTENPTSEFIPASITGRATIYEWRCTDGKPETAKQLFTPDQQGFLSEFWYEIKP